MVKKLTNLNFSRRTNSKLGGMTLIVHRSEVCWAAVRLICTSAIHTVDCGVVDLKKFKANNLF